MKNWITLTATVLLAATAAIAGPPLICHPVEIGNARSLAWRGVNGWDGADPSYDVSRLAADTMAILTPSAPLNVRMETIRRAAVYSVRKPGVADQLALQLLNRAANSETAGKPDALAWFDAGYYAEAMRQMGFIHRHMKDGLQGKWQWQGEWKLDGKPWMDRAVRLGLKGTEVAFAKVEEMRNSDVRQTQAASTATARK
ncbi:MAG: hypothetical protein HY820_12625 [Acidobacteria bacterium]|nr:hypothetical protein [Acidobacteriota bacterium]